MNLQWWSKFYTWVGFLGGVILQDAPWKRPSMKSWISWNNLYTVWITAFQVTFDISLEIAEEKLIPTSESTQIYLRRVISSVLLVFSTGLALWKRAYLWIYAKRLVQFTNKLESHEYFGNQNGSYCSNTKLNSFAGITLFLALAYAAVTEFSIVQDRVFAQLWFVQLTFWPLLLISTYCSIFTGLFIFTTAGFVLTRTIHLLNTLDDLCNQLECPYKKLNSDLTLESNGESDNPEPVLESNDKNSIWIISKDLICKVQEVKLMFKEYDSLYGPIVLLLVVIDFILGILQADRILDKRNSLLQIGVNAVGVFNNSLIVFFLMELGHKAHALIAERKLNLKVLKQVTKPETPADDAVAIFLDWEWKMTACNFFTVDRSLVTGLLAALMSYVIVLFQLHTSENSAINAEFGNSTKS